MTNPTQHEKTLSIAEVMYGEECVKTFPQNGICIRNNEMKPFKEFNPYTSAEDSQEIQEFFSIGTARDAQDNWVAYRREANAYSKDIKTAIAEAAFQITKEK